ncbi:MAG: diphosphomevalonate decarboxylase [Woeseiaceae bacterium]|jgi:diphosphomevalonate decarboxylase|nr:diphosphomevalonate decarboxylase [Woeseiaceae bacterium]
MHATAIAQPNIALVKYWGKRDVSRNLPAVGSISITLSDLYTEVSIDLSSGLSQDELLFNGERNDEMLPRIATCIDSVVGEGRPRVRINSKSNFPIAAGLASSASAFAATTVAAASAAGLSFSTLELTQLAGQASGSAARSLYGGFAELKNAGESIEVTSLCDVDSWPMQVIVAITETGPKAVGSTVAMEASRKTSPFYENWIAQQDQDLDSARAAIDRRDFESLAVVAEHNCLKMHSVMWASRPPLVYWNAATMACMQRVRRLQEDGCKVFFTIDAGPQVKAVCLPEYAATVREALEKTPGVQQVMESGLGSAARLVEPS